MPVPLLEMPEDRGTGGRASPMTLRPSRRPSTAPYSDCASREVTITFTPHFPDGVAYSWSSALILL
jgi:hypothetical protein